MEFTKPNTRSSVGLHFISPNLQLYGLPNQDSDFDLLVIVSESDQPRYRRSRLAYWALRGISFPTDVIVMTREEVNKKLTVRSSLVRQALDQGKVVYG